MLFRSTSTTLSVVKEELLVDWICDHYQDFGCKLRLVSDKSAVGSQFVIGFGGIGGILRWKVDFVGEKEAEFRSDNECDEDLPDPPEVPEPPEPECGDLEVRAYSTHVL